MDNDYLTRHLAGRVSDLRDLIGHRLEVIMRRNAADGRLASGASLVMFTDEASSTFEQAYADALQFAFSATGGHEKDTVAQLNLCGSEMISAVMAQATERANRLGIAGPIVPQQLDVMRHKLEDKHKRLTDDFAHGIQGNERLKKDPLVNVVNNNSPGTIQQVGIGNFSQSAFLQNNTELVNAIDQALASEEFKALDADTQATLHDTAEVLKGEASRINPDPGKLKRWGGRLVQMCNDVGIKVGGHALAQVLIKMFGG
ncbi:hypothetical protein ACVWXO_010773 [Bradyrhizobium sp. LM2.7]